MNPFVGVIIAFLLQVVICEHSKDEILLNECYRCAQSNDGNNKICRDVTALNPKTDKIKCCSWDHKHTNGDFET